jgi:hypothetical protein
VPLSADDLAAIDAMLLANPETLHAASGLAEFRQRFPRLSLTRCDASDVDAETAFRQYPGLNLYLVDATDHCAHITSDPGRATGIVVARAKASV